MAGLGLRGLSLLRRRGRACASRHRSRRLERRGPRVLRAAGRRAPSNVVSGLYRHALPMGPPRKPLEDEGGWAHRETAEFFEGTPASWALVWGTGLPCGRCSTKPWCCAFLGYGPGPTRPASGSRWRARRGAPPEPRARARDRRAPRRRPNDPGYSITLNLHVIRPSARPAPRRQPHRRARDRVFLGPLLEGEYPADVIADTAGVTDWWFVKPATRRSSASHRPARRQLRQRTVTVEDVDGGARRAPRPTDTRTWAAPPRPGSEDVEFLVQPGPYTGEGMEHRPSGLEDLRGPARRTRTCRSRSPRTGRPSTTS